MRAMKGWVWLEFPEEKQRGKIIIPKLRNPETGDVALVLQHGPRDIHEDLTGKTVVYNKYGGSVHKIDGKMVHVVEEDRILGVIE